MPALSLFLARLLWASLERPFAQLITADWEGRKSEATAAWSTLEFGNPNPTLLFVLVKSVAFSIKKESQSRSQLQYIFHYVVYCTERDVLEAPRTIY